MGFIALTPSPRLGWYGVAFVRCGIILIALVIGIDEIVVPTLCNA